MGRYLPPQRPLPALHGELPVSLPPSPFLPLPPRRTAPDTSPAALLRPLGREDKGAAQGVRYLRAPGLGQTQEVLVHVAHPRAVWLPLSRADQNAEPLSDLFHLLRFRLEFSNLNAPTPALASFRASPLLCPS